MKRVLKWHSNMWGEGRNEVASDKEQNVGGEGMKTKQTGYSIWKFIFNFGQK
jgi:hypothetical protein